MRIFVKDRKIYRKMQNKKSLLQRLLVIYITFFIVLVASIAHGFLPGFSRGYSQGSELGDNIVKNWASGKPRMFYILGNVSVSDGDGFRVGDNGNATTVNARVSSLDLMVEQNAPGATPMELALRSIGGSPWIYTLVMLKPLCFTAIIVLMFIIIGSLRRSIREERTLDKRNVWFLRLIGGLTIFMELLQSTVNWYMSREAVELLAGSGYTVDTSFNVSYPVIIMGILILFAAEVFAIGQNLSEEQKLTI